MHYIILCFRELPKPYRCRAGSPHTADRRYYGRFSPVGNERNAIEFWFSKLETEFETHVVEYYFIRIDNIIIVIILYAITMILHYI